MSSIFPAEVLEILFQFFLHDEAIRAQSSIVSILCVCRAWYNICLRILWRDPSFHSIHSLQRFTSAPKSNGFALTRSLTVSFEVLEPKQSGLFGDTRGYLPEDYGPLMHYSNKDTREMSRALDQVPASISYMTHLQAFSLSLHCSSAGVTPRGFWLPHSTIYNIVKQLPLSLRYLEIDLKGQERTTSTDIQTDICEAVAARLPHLRHVRLRLVRCCEKLFVPSDTLRTMVISTISPFGCSDVRQCGNRSHDVTAGNRYNSEVCDATRHVLVESALRVLDKLPRLEKLIIIDQQAGEDGSLRLMNVREIKAARTLSLPLLFLHGWLENHSQVNLRLPTPDDAARDVVGLITGVEQAAEGHMWATTSTGSRFPIAYRGAPEGRAHQWVKLHPYETKEEYISHRHGQMIGLWQDEEDMGRPLMAARETEGLGKADPIFKEKTPRELQWEQEELERVELEESDDDMRIDPFD